MDFFAYIPRPILRVSRELLERGIGLLSVARNSIPYVASAKEEAAVARALAVPPGKRVVRCSDLGTRYEPNIWLLRAPAHDPRIAPLLREALEEAGRKTKEAEAELKKKLADARGGDWEAVPDLLPPIPPAGAEVPWSVIRLARQAREMSPGEPRFEEVTRWLSDLHRAHGTPDEIIQRRVDRLMTEEPEDEKPAAKMTMTSAEEVLGKPAKKGSPKKKEKNTRHRRPS